jgi:hypothetical protein
MDLVVFQYLYGGFDAWPINTEFQLLHVRIRESSKNITLIA